MPPTDAILRENARELYDALQLALRYLTFSALDRSPAWRVAVAALRAAVLAAGGTPPDGRESSEDAWRRLM